MSKQCRYWMLVIKQELFTPYLPEPVAFITGQLEEGKERKDGAERGYLHWQLYVHFKRAVRRAAVKKLFGDGIWCEPTICKEGINYCLKEETAIQGTRFELGKVPLKRNSDKDWDLIRTLAKEDKMDEIPSDVYIRSYHNLKRIASEHSMPQPIERTIYVFWGKTGTGKSKRAWEEATYQAYPKSPTSKFWDGYRGHENVVIDEFRGQIEISHVLRWFDRYPVLVEVKGSSTVLNAKTIWITSNIPPQDWYPNIDEETKNALLRGLRITHFSGPISS